MRHFSVLTTAVVALVVGGLTLPSYADPAAPVLPKVADDHAAEQALEHAQEVLSGVSEGDATLALVALQAALPELEGQDRDTALALMARPDGTAPTFGGEPRYGSRGKALCGRHICIHYVTSGSHRVRATDADGDNRPDWVETNLRVMEKSWAKEVGGLGFRAPRKDGTRGNIPGRPSTHRKIDVYLAQLPDGFFGYAQPESDPAATSDGRPRTNTAHMVLDVDFRGFSCTPIVCLRATAAHEFFHVIQFAYDTYEQRWFMESTATWMEERVFDGANDNRQFLSSSSIAHPVWPLDDERAMYGNWAFHESYTQRLGSRLVREEWYRAGQPGIDALEALDGALTAHGSSLKSSFARFGAAGNVPAAGWSEGSVYPTAPSTAATATALGVNLWSNPVHLASKNFAFTPTDATLGVQLRLTPTSANLDGTACAAVVAVGGTVTWVMLPLNVPSTVDFSSSTVSKVYVNLGNAATSGGGQQVRLNAQLLTP
jgi:hypothetical protein